MTHRFATIQNVTDDRQTDRRQTTHGTKGSTDSTVGQKIQKYVIGTEKDGPIKQADTIMLNYPLNWNYSVDIMKNDLEFYELLTSERTPAMTWSWFTIGWKWVGEESKMKSYFIKSYQDYIIEPFKVTVLGLI